MQQTVSKSRVQDHGIYAWIDLFHESSDRLEVARRLRPVPQGAEDKIEIQG